MAEVKAIKAEEGANQKTGQPPRVKGSEVFVGGLSHTVTEDMIRELFSSCGEVVEIRMMKDQNGASKGYCFVRFAMKEAAMKAQKEKNNITLQGKRIGVVSSSDKDILFLGTLRKEWLPEEVESMVRQAFQDVVSVEVAMPPRTGESPPDKRKLNRGFAFVHFASHAHLTWAMPFIVFSVSPFSDFFYLPLICSCLLILSGETFIFILRSTICNILLQSWLTLSFSIELCLFCIDGGVQINLKPA